MAKFKPSFPGDTPFAAAMRSGIEQTGGTHGGLSTFFIHGEAFTGDADGPNNMDLFVVAPNDKAAVSLWKRHFCDWDMPADITVYTLPAQPGAGVIAWQSMKPTTVTITKKRK